jgi:hypothetical protein
MGILKLITHIGFGFCKLLRAHRGQFTNWALCNGSKHLKAAFETTLMKKQKQNLVLTSFRYSFCSEEACPGPGFSRESFQATRFLDSGPAL